MLKELLEDKLNKISPEKNVVPEVSNEYYPSLYLKAKDLPAIKNWEVGEDYYVTLKITMKSKEKYENEERKSISACFDIKEIGEVENDDYDEGDDDELIKSQLMKKYAR